MIKKKVLAILTLSILAGVIQAQTIFTGGGWEEIRTKAKAENKLIFVDLYFEGCMPCAEMDRRVFPDTTVGQLLNAHFVSFKSDVFKEEIGARLSMKYAASGFPTYLFLTAEGHAVDVVSGFISVTPFVSLLRQVIDKAHRKDLLGYDPGLDLTYPDFYRKAYMERKRRVPQDTVDTYLSTRSDLSDELSFVVMNTFRTDERYSSFYIAHAKELAAKYGRLPVRNRLASLIGNEGLRLGKERKQAHFENILSTIRPLFAANEWGRFSSGFFDSYYEGSKDVPWMLHKLESEKDTYTDWQDKSNVLAKVIIDAKGQPKALEQLAEWYRAAVHESGKASDYYKAALVHLYLQRYDEALRYADLAAKKVGQGSYLKKENIDSLIAAAQSGDTDRFKPIVAVEPKGYTLD